MKRNRITKLTLEEVSAVDKPAQVGARAVLIKRAGLPPDDWKVIKGMFVDALADEESRNMSNGYQSPIGKILEPLADTNIALREALEATFKYDVIANKKVAIATIAAEYFTKVHAMLGEIADLATNFQKGVNTMNVNEIKEQVAVAVKKALGDEASEGNQTDVSDAVLKAIEPAIEANREASVVAALPADHREYLDDIAKSASHSEAERAELRKQFLSTDATDESRAAVVKAWGDSGETFKAADGRIYKRSELGSAFDLFVEQVRKQEATDKELADLRKRKEEEDLIAKSKEAFPNLPGDNAARVALEKSLGEMPEEAAKSVRAMLKSGSEASGQFFKSVGQEGGSDPDSWDAETKLNKMAHELVQKSDSGMTFSEAYTKVMETPEGTKLYNQHVQESSGRPVS